ncbi:hypothetical protein AYO38_03910 [bacterium SCGC AG-212-C10]|nr:hypothetical protein AYO38_03910 [bacterium SCGC AG-212-C10]
MSDLSTSESILAEAQRIAAEQPGGTLATVHSEDATPYVTYVLFHLCPDGRVLFGSNERPQHSRNMAATPEVSFLIDNREVVSSDWNRFDRIVIEGRAEHVKKDDARYAGYLADLRAKNETAAQFTEAGNLYCIFPRRMILAKGLNPGKHLVEFE